VKRIADAVEHGVVDAAAAVLVQLEPRIQKQLVRQLLVGHAPRQSGVRATAALAPAVAVATGRRRAGAGERARQPVVVELPERVHAGDLLQLGAEALDLRAELDLELGVLRLVGREVLLGLVQRDERVLDAAGELGLVGDLPRLEPLEVLEQQRREVLAHLRRHRAERLLLPEHRAHLLELGQQRRRRVQQRVLQRAHRLEHMRRTVRDHVSRQEHPHVDVLRSESARRRAVAERRQQVDALQARLGNRDHPLLPQSDDQVFEAAEKERKTVKHRSGELIKSKQIKTKTKTLANKNKPHALDPIGGRTVLEEVGHQLVRLVVAKLATPHPLDVEDVVPMTGGSRGRGRTGRQCLGEHFRVWISSTWAQYL